jgi:hypothetical protein
MDLGEEEIAEEDRFLLQFNREEGVVVASSSQGSKAMAFTSTAMQLGEESLAT